MKIKINANNQIRITYQIGNSDKQKSFKKYIDNYDYLVIKNLDKYPVNVVEKIKDMIMQFICEEESKNDDDFDCSVIHNVYVLTEGDVNEE